MIRAFFCRHGLSGHIRCLVSAHRIPGRFFCCVLCCFFCRFFCCFLCRHGLSGHVLCTVCTQLVPGCFSGIVPGAFCRLRLFRSGRLLRRLRRQHLLVRISQDLFINPDGTGILAVSDECICASLHPLPGKKVKQFRDFPAESCPVFHIDPADLGIQRINQLFEGMIPPHISLFGAALFRRAFGKRFFPGFLLPGYVLSESFFPGLLHDAVHPVRKIMKTQLRADPVRQRRVKKSVRCQCQIVIDKPAQLLNGIQTAVDVLDIIRVLRLFNLT